ncbi:unnamed protein product [Acanthosepion pharaonis]|uniref:Uncharacterized protein n=1 Tax=Acanthosepion pharaonis TaxID=158019 RepID=A0A812ARM5_ACAPH|nr:unnamed protein product [Sepia pharaonis]
MTYLFDHQRGSGHPDPYRGLLQDLMWRRHYNWVSEKVQFLGKFSLLCIHSRYKAVFLLYSSSRHLASPMNRNSKKIVTPEGVGHPKRDPFSKTPSRLRAVTRMQKDNGSISLVDSESIRLLVDTSPKRSNANFLRNSVVRVTEHLLPRIIVCTEVTVPPHLIPKAVTVRIV